MKIGGLFIAVALVLAGCSSEPQPRDPTTSATPTSTATPPPMPPQASEDGPEGAAAFVSYWVEVSNYAAATGDVDELSRISDPDCSGCQSYIDLYRDTYEAGGYFKGGAWEANDIEVETVNDEQQVFVRISSPPGISLSSDGGNKKPTRPENAELIFNVRSSGGEQILAELARSVA